jgi:hypothetical protein
MKAIFIGGISLTILVALSSAAATDTYIQCPVRSIETNVTTRLPDGWWSTPQGGNLTDTEIVSIGGRPKLLCIYRTPGTEVSITRDAPSGASCTATNAGFKCKGAARQETGKGNAKALPVDLGTSAKVATAIPNDKSIMPGNVKVDMKTQVASKGSCPDLTIGGVEVQMLSRDPQGEYFFRLVATVENRGAVDYRSSQGQQFVEILEVSEGGSSRRVRNLGFDSIAAGGEGFDAKYDVLRWRTSQEFPPAYRFTIVLDPDIRSDGNRANDECTAKNNSATITGAEINSIIRGSGI